MLVREAVFEAVSMASVALTKSITVRVFNADPAPQLGPERSSENPCKPKSIGGIPVLNYNLLSENVINPWSLIGYLKYHVNNVKKILSDIRNCGLNEDELKNILITAKKIIASFRVGALLELIDLVLSNPDWSSKVEEIINNAYSCWLNEAKVKENNGVVKIVFNTNIMDGFKLLLHAHAIYTGIKRKLEALHKGIVVSYRRKDGISLKTIEEITKSFFGKYEVITTLVKGEIGVIEIMRKNRLIPSDWKPYAELYKVGGYIVTEGEEEVDEERLIRNLIAHAGLLKNYIELRELNGDVRIRIKEDKIEKINEILEKIFEELTIQH